MTEIKLKADEARDEAAHIQSEAAAAKEQMNNLGGRLSGLVDSFTGRTQVAFNDEFNEWKASADQMLESLAILGQLLNQAANAIEELDMQIASNLSAS